MQRGIVITGDGAWAVVFGDERRNAAENIGGKSTLCTADEECHHQSPGDGIAVQHTASLRHEETLDGMPRSVAEVERLAEPCLAGINGHHTLLVRHALDNER